MIIYNLVRICLIYLYIVKRDNIGMLDFLEEKNELQHPKED